MKQPFLASVFCVALVASTSAAEILTSHADIRFDYLTANGTWDCHVQYGGSIEEPAVEADPESVAFPVRDLPSSGAGDRYAQPGSASFSFTGTPAGQPLWILPQSDRGYTWPGFDNAQVAGTFLSYQPSDSRTTTAARWWKISLVSVGYSGASSGSPHFSLWTTGAGGAPTVWMATSDGIASTDCYYTTENSHSHLNWGFTKLGVYRITLRPSAFLANGSLVENGDHTLTFAVGTLATWRATHFSGPEIVDEDIGVPLADPDGDGAANLIEYAFNTDPNVPSSAPLTPGSGTSGLPAVLLENIGGTDRLTIDFVRRKSASNPQITYHPEFSGDLATGSWVAGQALSVTSIDSNWERVKVVDSQPAGTRRFARVRIATQAEISY